MIGAKPASQRGLVVAEKKNVLLIVVDQWRGDTLSYIGHPSVQTPHLDALCRDSTVFRNHYTQCAPCGPARASLLTSLYMMNHRVVQNGIPMDTRHATLPIEMRKYGYDSALVGYTTTSPRSAPDALRRPALQVPRRVDAGLDADRTRWTRRAARISTGCVSTAWTCRTRPRIFGCRPRGTTRPGAPRGRRPVSPRSCRIRVGRRNTASLTCAASSSKTGSCIWGISGRIRPSSRRRLITRATIQTRRRARCGRRPVRPRRNSTRCSITTSGPRSNRNTSATATALRAT